MTLIPIIIIIVIVVALLPPSRSRGGRLGLALRLFHRGEDVAVRRIVKRVVGGIPARTDEARGSQSAGSRRGVCRGEEGMDRSGWSLEKV